MTVKELIAQLQTFDQDAPVLVEIDGHYVELAPHTVPFTLIRHDTPQFTFFYWTPSSNTRYSGDFTALRAATAVLLETDPSAQITINKGTLSS